MKGPRLHLDDLDNESRVLGAVDQLCTGDRTYWKLTRRILKAQLRHQELASDDAFVALLELEEIVNDRMNLMLAITARWAFNEGRRSRKAG